VASLACEQAQTDCPVLCCAALYCCATQADVAVLVISSRKGEYETGFEKGGQTREHAQV
jgi:translation elongation factor EF-1alpha